MTTVASMIEKKPPRPIPPSTRPAIVVPIMASTNTIPTLTAFWISWVRVSGLRGARAAGPRSARMRSWRCKTSSSRAMERLT